MTRPKAIIVICIRFLGDTLLLRPPLRALRRAFPQARIDVIVAGGTGIALEGCPHVDHVYEWPARSPAKLARIAFRIFAAGYDWAVDFTGNDRSSLVAVLSHARHRIAYERPKKQRRSLRSLAFNIRIPYRRPKPHILIQRLELLSAVGVEPDGFSCDLEPRMEDLETTRRLADGLPSRRLHIHPTSRDMQKAIPAKILREVVERIISEGWGVVITTGSQDAERSHVEAALPEMPGNCRVFSGLSWGQLVAMVSTATCYWGCDTAPGHLASALGIPVRIEFGPSHAGHWEPLHDDGLAVVHPCACRMDPENSHCPAGRPAACLDAIRAGDVADWAKAVAGIQHESTRLNEEHRRKFAPGEA